VFAGGGLGLLGLAAAGGSFALPWVALRARGSAAQAGEVVGTGKLFLLSFPQGNMYLAGMLALAGALALAWLGAGWMRRGAGVAAVLLAVVVGVLVLTMRGWAAASAGRYDVGFGNAEVQYAVALDDGWYLALLAAALLGVGAALVASARPAE
jgi:hypothetical protein